MPDAAQGTPGGAPEQLHPALWRADCFSRVSAGSSRQGGAVASGFKALDAELPEGGWPAGALTEILLPHPGLGELRLLAPALGSLQGQQRERCMMWFDPPAEPCAWALESLGLRTKQLVVVRAQDESAAAVHARGGRALRTARGGPSQAHRLWAVEHALKSGHVAAVLVWLPARMPVEGLRRLQLAAQAHEGPVFVFRHEDAATNPSPAPLRLHLAPAGPDGLRITLLKRRGPPLAQPLVLQLAPVLATAARARARAGSRVPGPAVDDGVAVQPASPSRESAGVVQHGATAPRKAGLLAPSPGR